MDSAEIKYIVLQCRDANNHYSTVQRIINEQIDAENHCWTVQRSRESLFDSAGMQRIIV